MGFLENRTYSGRGRREPERDSGLEKVTTPIFDQSLISLKLIMSSLIAGDFALLVLIKTIKMSDDSHS